MYQNNRSSVSHFLHIKMPGNNLNISGNWSEIYAIILNTLTDWILTFCFIARECRWHVATFWQTLTINIQNCTELRLTLQLHFASRSSQRYQGWKLRHCQHTECLLYGGERPSFSCHWQMAGILANKCDKTLVLTRHLLCRLCLYLLQSLNQIHDETKRRQIVQTKEAACRIC